MGIYSCERNLTTPVTVTVDVVVVIVVIVILPVEFFLALLDILTVSIEKEKK